VALPPPFFRSRHTPAVSPLDIVFVVGAFGLILVGAEFFTGGIEWLGIRLDLSHGATGSVLAAIGTATPETLVPIVAIVFTSGRAADDIGVGAILGAPFMLGTLVMSLIGLTAFVLRRRRRRTTLRIDAAHASRDLGFFIVLYAVAIGLALLPDPLRFLKDYVGWIFLPAYVLYLYLVLRTPKSPTKIDILEEKEEEEAFEDLSFALYLRRAGLKLRAGAPPLWLVLAQVMISFAAIVAGARFFATFVNDLSSALGLDALLVALILAPLATELPEAANSLIWTREGKDVIALGNVAGAMVFQATIPVSVGVLLTPWRLGQYGTVAAAFALLAGVAIYAQIRLRAQRDALPLSSLMVGGSLYLLFIAYVIWTVATGQTS
jgi:cation:H+ antiporter